MRGELTLHERAEVHAALGDEYRLAIVDSLLVSDRSPSELSRALHIGSNLLAHHLDVLEAARVIERLVSTGDGRRRYVHLRHETMAQVSGQATARADHVLFVCTGNSARSQLAAAIWNRASTPVASSAGTHPAAQVHPKAVTTAARHGLDLSEARPQQLEDAMIPRGLIVTLCDRAHEALPAIEAPRLHWSLPDPAEANTQRAFEATYASIETRIAVLAPLVTPARRR